MIAEITESLANGKKIEAIKTYREATGKGLRESKEFIDQLIPGLIEKDPQRFATFAKGSGCGMAVLVTVGLACVICVSAIVSG